MEEEDYEVGVEPKEENPKKRKNNLTQTPQKKQKLEETITLEDPDYKYPILIPSHSIWFKISEINDIEKRSLPEFFEGKSSTKTPEIYKEYRNYMVKSYREHPNKYLTATVCRKALPGDISTIMKVHAFLEHWGLINYGVTPSKVADLTEDSTVVHDYQKQPSIDKLIQLTPVPPFIPKDFNTNPIIQNLEWTQDEVMKLLKGIEVYNDDWTKISLSVGTKSKEECLTYFLRMPIEDEFLTNNVKTDVEQKSDEPLPFSDTLNPIMQTIAFLASSVDPGIAAAAAQSALKELENIQNGSQNQTIDITKLDLKTISATAIGASAVKAKLLAQKEEREIQRLMAYILEKQMKKLEIKLKSLDHLEKLMVKERLQLEENTKKLQEEKLKFQTKSDQ